MVGHVPPGLELYAAAPYGMMSPFLSLPDPASHSFLRLRCHSLDFCWLPVLSSALRPRALRNLTQLALVCFHVLCRREILHVACGNNCTLVLAGEVAFPTLFEMTAGVIRGNPKLCADVGGYFCRLLAALVLFFCVAGLWDSGPIVPFIHLDWLLACLLFPGIGSW